MSRKIWIGLSVVLVAVVAVSLIARPRGAEWTTDSPEALAEFAAATDAMMKLYHDEAVSHLERAIELDPDFVMAKLFLADQVRYDDEDRALRLWNDVLASDRSKLTPREALYVERSRAIQEKRFEDIDRMTEEFLAENPDDPYILHLKALNAWYTGDFETSEKLNRRLIEIAPNWVIAYNQLGYIAMSRGRFVEAEEYFTSYRFVAPDQANPHDSLGELYVILGRYEEAEVSLRQSIEIKPDFWNAYDHLIRARTQLDDFAGAEDVVAEAKAVGDVPEYWEVGMGCMVEIGILSHAGQWQEILDMLGEDAPCLEGHSEGYARVMKHLAACIVGDMEAAEAVTATIEGFLAKAQESEKMDVPLIEGTLSHLRGVRAAVRGDYENAIEDLWDADRKLTYMQAGTGLFKLYNRLYLVEALFAAGNDGKAHKVLSKVRSVNPRLAQEFEENGLKILGLERE
jgi:tetratricopeptide (TPR) repeat protein